MKIVRASKAQKPLVEELMQPYLLEISKFDGSEPEENGRFSLGEYFTLYWSESGRFPYLLWDGDTPIGFALVRQIESETYSVAEFFVRQENRGQGTGRHFARELFRRHSGTWRVAQLEKNTLAQKFWRSVIDEFTGGNFREEWSAKSPKGPVQVFSA